MVKLDILKHVLVPKHTILTSQEKENLLADLNVSEFQLPSILHKDPVIEILKAKQGDIIKIEREGVLGKETAFRRVI